MGDPIGSRFPGRKKWSEMTPEEHLDAAQECLAKLQGGENGLHRGVITAQLHTQAAMVLKDRP